MESLAGIIYMSISVIVYFIPLLAVTAGAIYFAVTGIKALFK